MELRSVVRKTDLSVYYLRFIIVIVLSSRNVIPKITNFSVIMIYT